MTEPTRRSALTGRARAAAYKKGERRAFTTPNFRLESGAVLPNFPVRDARYGTGVIPGVSLRPIPSVWGRTAGAASSPADAKFLNDEIGRFPGVCA